MYYSVLLTWNVERVSWKQWDAVLCLLCSLLASGSDDVQVIIWDPFRKKQLTTIRTGHNGNIFSVKVSPFTLSCMIFVNYVPRHSDS